MRQMATISMNTPIERSRNGFVGVQLFPNIGVLQVLYTFLAALFPPIKYHRRAANLFKKRKGKRGK